MRPFFGLLVILAPVLLSGEGTAPKPKPRDYGVHVQVAEVTIGAEFEYRSFSAAGRSFFVDKHLVVEVALYGPKGKRLNVSAGQFSLRVNGKNRALLPQAPQVIAYATKWEDSGLVVMGGMGNRRVILGGPEPGPRFPGDPRRSRSPSPSSSPVPEDRTGVSPRGEVDQGKLMAEAALPHGDKLLPVSGYIYFRYNKKTKSIKKLELLYQGPAGATSLRLK